MQNFWEIVIEPALAKIKPQHIIEIGADKGGNTVKALSFGLQHNCAVTSIDPFPQFDYLALEQFAQGQFNMVTDLSLKALPHLGGCDVALIDGDHNWYTVYHELQAIYQNNKRENRRFPVIFFHDIGWPYGRRDMYYDPSNIPQEYVLPYRKAGIVLGVSELQDDRGINANLANAEYEGGECNGVLTAVEDFVKDCELDLTLYTFYGLHGLGILFENTAENHQIFSPLEIQQNIADLLELIRLSQLGR